MDRGCNGADKVSKKLEDAIVALNKQFGKGTVIPMAQSRASEAVDVISTGNKIIDDLTGIGGIPKGRITEVYGPEAGGKSTLCLQIIAQAQAAGGVCAYVDAENALDMTYAAALGVKVEDLLVSQPSCGEEGLSVALGLIESGGVSVVVVDSVAALVPRSELEGDIGDAQMGLMGRMMGQALRKINNAVATTGTALIFINQVRQKLGIVFGNPETTSGGMALRFYASLRMDIRRISQIKKGDVVIGAKTKVGIVKNKLAAPAKKGEVDLLYGKGFVNE
jgi:recombination protein RecA